MSTYTPPSPSHIPISPPAPRRAPRPPTYKPRRPRSRHIRMREPARLGLFTVCEVDESASASASSDCETVYSDYPASMSYILGTPSANASSELLAPSPMRVAADMPMDVDDESISKSPLRSSLRGISLRGLVWDEESDCPSVSTGPNSAPTSALSSPNPMEVDTEDPFIFDSAVPTLAPLSTSNLRALNALDAASPISTLGAARSRRPPPLDLSRQHPFRSSVQLDTAPTAKARSHRAKLLPALPILPPSRVSPTTPRKSGSRYRRSPSPNDPVDLVSALEDLLAACGEELPTWSDSDGELDVSYDAFPLPPSHSPRSPLTPASDGVSTPSTASSVSLELRTPRTPPCRIAKYLQRPSGTSSRGYAREPIVPNFKGDHGFLQSMSTGCDSPVPSLTRSSTRSASSGDSRSSRKSLPERKRLPIEWMA